MLKTSFQYHYTIDDVIFALEDITKNQYTSIFENDFFRMLKEVHDQHGLCVNLALFYKTSPSYKVVDDNFTLANVTDAYKAEFQANSDWMKMSAHSWDYETQYSQEIRNFYRDYETIKTEAIRFAGLNAWYGNYTCIHLYNGTANQLRELSTNIPGKVFLISKAAQLMPSSTSYVNLEKTLKMHSELVYKDKTRNVLHLGRTGVLERILGVNQTNETFPDIKTFLNTVKYKQFIEIGTHETYFTLARGSYNPSVVQAFYDMGEWMNQNGYKPGFPSDDMVLMNWV